MTPSGVSLGDAVTKTWLVVIAMTAKCSGLEAADDGTTYQDGAFRRVKPYHYTFRTHVKDRWVGQALFDVVSQEFQEYDSLFWVRMQVSLQ